MQHAVIVSAVRTPVGTFGGYYKDVSATELGSHAIRAALGREPSIFVVIVLAIAGALCALALQRYVIIVATAFGGAWTTLVGGLALAGNRMAGQAAARNDVWLA